MKPPAAVNATAVESKAFWLLVVAISVAFAGIVSPFYGALLWGTVLAIVFVPLHHRLERAAAGRRGLAALATVAIILVLVILPLLSIGGLLLQEAVGVYGKMQSRELDLASYGRQIFNALPPWIGQLPDRLGLTNLASVQDQLSAGLKKGAQFLGARALDIGQNTFDFLISAALMLYLLFFFLRDGVGLSTHIRDAIPLRPELQQYLSTKFIATVRAIMKGTVVVAIVQGALGGLIFWFLGIHAPLLWAVVMAFLSLLPVIGAALVWLPVAIYLLATGSVWQGLVLIGYGVLVIGLVDNVLRPILVGKDTKVPDYLILVSTLGGIALFGVNGLLIGPLVAAMFVAVWATVARSRSVAGANRP